MLASRQKSTAKNTPRSERSRSSTGASREAVPLRGTGPAPVRNSAAHGATHGAAHGATLQETGSPQAMSVTPLARTAHSSGQPLDSATRTSMQSKLGHDLGGVRLHTGVGAAAAADALHAQAFTVAKDIYFGANAFRPGTPEGDRLLTHELVHTVQQASGPSAAPRTKLDVSQPGDPAEVEAERISDRLASGASTGSASPSPIPSPITAARKAISRALKTNGGEFEVQNYTETDTDPGNDSNKHVGAAIDINFTPAESIRSEKISFVQIMRTLDDGTPYLFQNEKARATEGRWWDPWDWMGESGWAVDRLAGKTSPNYAQENDGTAGGNTIFGKRTSNADFTKAFMHDGIRLPRSQGKTYSSDAKAYALDNTNGAYLGGITWGFDTDSAGKVTKKTAAVAEMGNPTGIQVEALEKWNEQASLPDTDAAKNAPGQEKVLVP